MPLGMDVSLSPGDFVLDGYPVFPPNKGPLPIFGPFLLCPNGWMNQDDTWYGGRHQPRRLWVRWVPSPLHKKGQSPQFLAHVYCGQSAAWIKMPLGMEVGLGPGEATEFDAGDQFKLPIEKSAHSPRPIFGPCLLWPNGWMDQDAT